MRYWLMVVAFIMSVAVSAQESTESVAAPAQSTQYVEGVHYLKLTAPVAPIVAADKVEIAELFSFSCPHCYHFEDAAEKWALTKPEAAELVKNPVIWRKGDATEKHAQVYFTGQKLGLGKETSDAIFAAIHDKKIRNAYLKDEDIFDLFETLGADRVKAEKVFKSFYIKSKVNQADARARSIAVAGTPEIVIDGRYRVTGKSAGGTHTDMLKVANFLVEKIVAERAASK